MKSKPSGDADAVPAMAASRGPGQIGIGGQLIITSSEQKIHTKLDSYLKTTFKELFKGPFSEEMNQ